jgi:hypothetical protein
MMACLQLTRLEMVYSVMQCIKLLSAFFEICDVIRKTGIMERKPIKVSKEKYKKVELFVDNALRCQYLCCIASTGRMTDK